MTRRVLTVILAVLLAALGTGAVLAYVNGANARALAGQKAVTVLVAQQNIPSGTTAGTALSNGWLASENLPASSVPAEAVRSLTPALNGLVTSADLPPGQLLLRPALVTTAQVTGALAIPAGKVAISVNLCVPEAVAGSLHPGSVVDIFDTATTASPSGTGSGSASVNAGAACSGSHTQQNGAHTKIVLPGVEVLSTGVAAPTASGTTSTTSTASTQSSSTTQTSSQGTMLVTMAVLPSDAAQLIQLTQTGLPYLALVK